MGFQLNFSLSIIGHCRRPIFHKLIMLTPHVCVPPRVIVRRLPHTKIKKKTPPLSYGSLRPFLDFVPPLSLVSIHTHRPLLPLLLLLHQLSTSINLLPGILDIPPLLPIGVQAVPERRYIASPYGSLHRRAASAAPSRSSTPVLLFVSHRSLSSCLQASCRCSTAASSTRRSDYPEVLGVLKPDYEIYLRQRATRLHLGVVVAADQLLANWSARHSCKPRLP